MTTIKLEVMELYRLEDILRMLLEEQQLGYANINQVLHIVRHGKQAPDRKRWTIISGLRYLNLYEIGYDGDKFTPDEGEGSMSDIEIAQRLQDKYFPALYQVFACDIMNGIARFDVIIN